MKFNELKLEKNILKALKEAGYSEPTPIQQQAIPPVLEGRDLMGCAQTGTGKTCAFAVPIIQRLAKSEGKKGTIRALILTPTRELALQIYENVCQYARYMPCSAAVIFGGVSQVPQVEAIERGVDILIATPGRLWDLMGQKIVKLDKAEFFVLDEADRMLDMGFFPDVKRIVKFLPKKRQTLLFSATIPAEIADLAEKMLHEPEHISVTPSAKPADKIEQQLYFVEKQEKRELLPDIIRQSNVHQAPSVRSSSRRRASLRCRFMKTCASTRATCRAVRRSSSAAYRRCRRSRRSNAVWIFSLPRRAVCGI